MKAVPCTELKPLTYHAATDNADTVAGILIQNGAVAAACNP